MIAIDLILFVLLIGLFGLVSHFLFFQDSADEKSGMIEWFAFRLLSGLATISILLLIAAFTGLFFKTVILSALAILLLLSAFKWFRRVPKPSLRLLPYLIFCFCVAISSFAVATLTRPYQAIIYSHDASVYIAFSLHLAASGGIQYADPLVLEMEKQERQAIFSKKSGLVRFDGGVLLRDLEKGIVDFGFLAFFPVWLAFAVLFLGTQQFLSLLSFFTVLGALLLFLIAKKLSGPLLGIIVPVVIFFFLPQFYFLRLPLTEGCAQTFFLGGLLAFINGSSTGNQRLSGILWGSLFLCRIELLFFMPVSLLLLFTLHPKYCAKWNQYSVLILVLAVFALVLFSTQLATGTYFQIWGVSHRPLMKLLWVPSVTFVTGLIKTTSGLLAFLLLSLAVLTALYFLLKKQIDSRHEKWIKMAGIALAAAVVLSLTGLQFDWRRILRNAWHVMLYIPDYFLFALLTGFVFLLFKRVRGNSHHLIVTLIIFFLLPFLFFIIRPLIVFHQPLFVRRFVIAAFPLFFLLSLAGWFKFLQIVIRPPILAKSIFVVFGLMLTFSFYKSAESILQKQLFGDVISQVQKLASQLPEDALVVIPSKELGFHMGLPMQYLMKRDSISEPYGAQNAGPFRSYLRRQIAKDRPVFIVTKRPPDKATTLIPDFSVEHKFSEKIVFYSLAETKAYRFPFRSTKVLRFYGYQLAAKAPG